MTAVLQVDSVVKRLGGRRVLDGVSLDCVAGRVCALYGNNGAGKSTLLQIVAGVMAPDRGAVVLCGESILGHHVRGRRCLGYVPEAADPPAHLTVAELVALTRSLKQAPPLADDLIARLGLESLRHKRIGQLSLGERRRACLAAALVGDPALLVLDEPTNGLDAAGIELLLELLRERVAADGTALMATHDRDFATAASAIELRLVEGAIQRIGEDEDCATG